MVIHLFSSLASYVRYLGPYHGSKKFLDSLVASCRVFFELLLILLAVFMPLTLSLTGPECSVSYSKLNESRGNVLSKVLIKNPEIDSLFTFIFIQCVALLNH
ncbi:hypothetical protein M758_4G192700 [Ceratodon purpureus]|uniref:Uncharacterized protein n=1 Tax=Ceratodon purpureus TaxID=3225 RepID=A0A8T0IB52_CERPU|nr:hypothetical protein KC19_4G189700 [Ceratodon purpureus]KAG0620146.1 hypothetical protein M758_4G192700 [Ceratodon purpureus]